MKELVDIKILQQLKADTSTAVMPLVLETFRQETLDRISTINRGNIVFLFLTYNLVHFLIISPKIIFPSTGCLYSLIILPLHSTFRGALKIRAEIIPIEPDTGNAVEGNVFISRNPLIIY